MFTTISQADAQEMLMKPIHITAVVNELIALENANVVSSNTVSDVVNLIFKDIRDSTQTLRDDWNNLILSVKEQSEYLYRTVGELNEMAGEYVSPYDDMATYQIFVDRVNNVYEKVKDGFESAGLMTQHIQDVNVKFFNLTALYKDNYANNYPNIAANYTANTMANIVDKMYTSDSLLSDQKTLFADLRDTYPDIAVESDDDIEYGYKYKEAIHLPTAMYVKLLPDNLFRIYNDPNHKTDIGSIFGEESLLARREQNYVIHVENCVAGQDPARRFMVINHLKGALPSSPMTTANVIFISQNTSATMAGSVIKSLAFEGSGPGNANTPMFYANTASGRDSVIRYTNAS